MENHWATQHLEVIRTLMERSALYRRALAPIMLTAGIIGLAAAGVGVTRESFQGIVLFTAYWMGVALVTMTMSFLLVRRQALKEGEPVWSLPAKRVAQAALPGLTSGCVLAAAVMLASAGSGTPWPLPIWMLPPAWMLFYGVALHAAGFFMPRGIRLFAWLFIGAAAVLLTATPLLPSVQSAQAAHGIMGLTFGLGQIAYGIYLAFSENRKPAP